MKVRCTTNINNSLYLTVGRIYEVIKESSLYYYIFNDKKYECDYSKERFEIIYSIEEIKKGKFAVEIDNESDWNKSNSIFGFTLSYYPTQRYYSKGGYASLTYYKERNYTIIKFNQIEMEEFVLPEKWCIKIIEENKNVLAEFYAKNAYSGYLYIIPEQYLGYYAFSHNLGSNDSIFSERPGSNFMAKEKFNFTEIAFEQFKKYVLKENDMEKKIIGYKLIKPEYIEAACRVAKLTTRPEENLNKLMSDLTNTFTINCFKEADVLDLWFEKVYENEYFKKGDWITIANLVDKSDVFNVLNKTFQIKEV